jgi:hypothetical protein
MAAKIKRWFNEFLVSLEKSGVERARKTLDAYGYRRWE